MGYIASIFVMITIISNNEYKTRTEEKHCGAFFFACTPLFSRVQNTTMCARRAKMSVEEALVDGKAGVPPVFAGGMRSSWWSLPSLAWMYSPQTNPIIVWRCRGASPAAELIVSPFSHNARFHMLVTHSLSPISHLLEFLRVPFSRHHARRKKPRCRRGEARVEVRAFYRIPNPRHLARSMKVVRRLIWLRWDCRVW